MVSRVIDNWIPAEFRCITSEGRVYAIYSGRVCEVTNIAVIVVNGSEFDLVLSTRQKASIREQMTVMRNQDILELFIQNEREQ